MNLENSADKRGSMSAARLFAVFTALESFRLCYLRLCFWITEETGLLELENMIFILFSFAMVAGMIFLPLILDKTRLSESPQKLKPIMRVFIVVTATAAIVSYFAQGYTALVFQFITTFFTAGSMAVCLRRIAGGMVAPRLVGLFIGLSFSVMALSGAVLFFLPFTDIPTGIILFVICVFLAVAFFLFEVKSDVSGVDEKGLTHIDNYAPFTRRLLGLSVLVLCVYALISGFLDNIYFFDAAFGLIPNFMLYILLYAAVCDVAAGFISARADPAAAVIGSLFLICLGQSMSFFSDNVLLVYPYTILSDGGNNIMSVYLVSIPIVYCAYTRRKGSLLPGLGYVLLYGGFFLSSTLFEFIPGSAHRTILGVTLIVSLAAIAVTFSIVSEGRGRRYGRLEREFNERLTAALKDSDAALEAGLTQEEVKVALLLLDSVTQRDIGRKLHIDAAAVGQYEKTIREKLNLMGEPDPVIAAVVEAFNLTKRETDILKCLRDGFSTDRIAAELYISEGTVRVHVSNLVKKLGIEKRQGVAAWLDERR